MHELTAEQIIRRFEKAKLDRSNWDHHWQEVADLVLPTRDFITRRTAGERRRSKIYNDTASEAAESLAAALDGMLTNTAIRWFSLVPDDLTVVEDEEVGSWLYDTETRMLAWFDSTDSGFAIAAHETYLDLVTFGTAVTLVVKAGGSLSYRAKQLANFYMRESESGEMSEMYRKFEMTCMDAYERWGDLVSEETAKKAKDPKKSDDKVSYLHYIYRRRHTDYGRMDGINKPWASIYIETKKKRVISRGGFDSNPYLTPRWSKSAEETYGRSPAMKMLPSIKVVNAMSRTQIEAAELAVRPPLMMPANSVEGPILTAPGSIMYIRGGTRDFPQPLITGARPDIAEGMIQGRESRIEKAFFLDSLKLPDRDRMTATEIIQRRQEGLIFASPILSRLYAEWLNPIIQRTFAWMMEANLLPPPPMALAGGGLNIHYVSPMAISKRAAESQAFIQAMSIATPLIQADPDVMSNLDSDVAFRAIMNQNNVNPIYLRSARDVMMARQREQEAVAQQQQIEAAQGGAAATRDAAAAMKDVADVGL